MDDESKITHLDGAPSLSDPEITPEDWVRRYCVIHRIEYHYKTSSFRQSGSLLDPSLLLSRMRLLVFNLEQKHLKALLPDAVAVWKSDREHKFLNSLRCRLKFKKDDRDWASEWVRAATGTSSPLDAAVLRHFIWQVKRKLFGLAVEHHIMLIAVGRSGGGKSVALHALLRPVEEVSLSRDMSIFNDAFGKRQFSRCYVILLDEMGKSHQADVNCLKNIITAKQVEWRAMNSEAIQSSPQNATFIGTSNHPVRERIQDTTSARRFWQLNCAPILDWNLINSIDYDALWKSVDENGPCPILPYLEHIQEIQNREIRAKDPLEDWIEVKCEPAEFTEDSPTTDDLYRDFKDWCKNQGQAMPVGIQTFARSLPRRFEVLNWPVASKHTHRGTTWSLRVRP